MVSERTRVSAKTAICIDNIFSNVIGCLVRVESIFISDHCYQLLSFDSPTGGTVNTHKVKKRVIDERSCQRFREYMLNANWDGLERGNLNDKFNFEKDGYNRRLINCDNLSKESWKVINEHRNPKGVMGIPEIRDATGISGFWVHRVHRVWQMALPISSQICLHVVVCFIHHQQLYVL
ncbi:hypothetical protein HHI36_001219 [Cryptolaemus montrouzieri]|uniref:Uncharacterized protein n=1 Tax=Cryptolaemus montrouzieri TaxID=559131 RepID=A0ABD2P6X7_9CUCU